MSHRIPNESVPVPEVVVPIRRAVIVLASIAAALVVIHVITRLVLWSGVYVPQPIALLLERFNVDQETAVPTWFSSLLLLGIAVVAFVLARTDRAEGSTRYRWWYAAAGVMLALAIDEAAAVHEVTFDVMQRWFGIASGPLLFAWVIPAGIAAIVVIGVFLRFFLGLPGEIRLTAGIGTAVFLAGALGMQMVKGALIYDLTPNDSGGSLPIDLLSGLEEALELAGAILVLRALLLHLARYVLPERALLLRLAD
jgi:hypothetical protein